MPLIPSGKAGLLQRSCVLEDQVSEYVEDSETDIWQLDCPKGVSFPKLSSAVVKGHASALCTHLQTRYCSSANFQRHSPLGIFPLSPACVSYLLTLHLSRRAKHPFFLVNKSLKNPEGRWTWKKKKKKNYICCAIKKGFKLISPVVPPIRKANKDGSHMTWNCFYISYTLAGDVTLCYVKVVILIQIQNYTTQEQDKLIMFYIFIKLNGFIMFLCCITRKRTRVSPGYPYNEWIFPHADRQDLDFQD